MINILENVIDDPSGHLDISIPNHSIISLDKTFNTNAITIRLASIIKIEELVIEKFVKKYLNEKLLNFLRDRNKVYFMVFFATEGFPLSMDQHKILKFFKELEKIIPPNKILVVFGDLYFSNTVRKYYDNHPKLKSSIPYENFLSYNHFERLSSMWVNSSKYNPLPYITKTKSLKKYFVYKNGNMRLSRLFTLCFLKSNNLLSRSHYSVLDQHNLSEHITKEMFYQTMSKLTFNYINYYNNFLEVKKELPIELDINKDSRQQSELPIFDPKYYKDSAFEIAVETNTDEFNDGTFCLTEKTFFPMFYRIPVLILGPKGTYKYLEENNYASFSELFNLEFDKEPDFVKRSQMFVREILRLSEMPLYVLEDIINTDNFQNKLNHNFYQLKKVISNNSSLEKELYEKFG